MDIARKFATEAAEKKLIDLSQYQGSQAPPSKPVSVPSIPNTGPVDMRGIKNSIQNALTPPKEESKFVYSTAFMETGITGFDRLTDRGVPRHTNMIVTGGPGSGKTLFCLNLIYNAALRGESALYVSFEESEERLRQYMRNFGWNVDELEKRGWLRIVRIDPFVVSRKVEALLAQTKGELSINQNELGEILPVSSLQPSVVVFDSLSALEAAFFDKDQGYRMLAEHLFRFLEKLKVTSFLITEGNYTPTAHVHSSIEEFMGDGIIAFYNIRQGNVRIRGLEIVKMRGTKHVRKIVPFDISNSGILVYPDEPVFIDEKAS